jgi:hypothetical protein
MFSSMRFEGHKKLILRVISAKYGGGQQRKDENTNPTATEFVTAIN